MRMGPIAKICQTPSKYFNMQKYGYIHHIINMFVPQQERDDVSVREMLAICILQYQHINYMVNISIPC